MRIAHRRPRCAASVMLVALVVAACSGSSAEQSAAPATDAAPPSNSVPPTSTTTLAPDVEPPSIVVVEVTGDEEVVFDWSEQACGGFQRPDLPARAFRSADGSISIIMAAHDNTRLVGPSLDDVSPSCEIIRPSSYDHDPAAHAHFEWIAAVHTDDGQTVHAVIHNEYHGYEAHLPIRDVRC